MKKILLLNLIFGSTLFSFGQLTPPPTTNSTSTGIVAGGNIATCSYAPGTPQSCMHVCRNSVQISGGPVDANPRTVHFEYYQVTSGNKSLHVQILCGTTLIVNDCINASADGNDVLMYKEYAVTCLNKSQIVVKIQAHTNGTCGGNECGPLLISQGGSPLPVEFKSFTATRNRSNVLLKWETASELSNSGFAVEHNINGSWQQVAWVPTLALNGNSDAVLSYSYSELNNAKGISQYRIRQVDMDTKSKFSEVRAVRGENQLGKTIVYPNPTNDGKVNVVFEDAEVTREIAVSDMSGRLVRQIKGITNNNITIENLQPGMYMIRIVATETGEQVVEKVVVNKR